MPSLQVCSEPGCPRFRPCPVHARTSTRNHGGVSRQARGYDRDYDGAKRQLVAAAKRGEPYACTLRLAGCTEIATTPHHTDDGRLAPACAHCNYADGARRSRDGQRDLDASFGMPRRSGA